MANMFIMYLIAKQYMTKIVKKLVVSNPRQSFIINEPNKVLFCGVTKIKRAHSQTEQALYTYIVNFNPRKYVRGVIGP